MSIDWTYLYQMEYWVQEFCLFSILSPRHGNRKQTTRGKNISNHLCPIYVQIKTRINNDKCIYIEMIWSALEIWCSVHLIWCRAHDIICHAQEIMCRLHDVVLFYKKKNPNKQINCLSYGKWPIPPYIRQSACNILKFLTSSLEHFIYNHPLIMVS